LDKLINNVHSHNIKKYKFEKISKIPQFFDTVCSRQQLRSPAKITIILVL